MAKYECNLCGMSVKTNCGHCDAPLVNAMLDLDDGTQVQISQCQKSECSNYEGKIKSPLCCGNDMSCSL
jgi:hypothetical protein|tara:strand:- start:24 stop:230 length:207 start_codon:yes stop_codon:yes gene_type:complete